MDLQRDALHARRALDLEFGTPVASKGESRIQPHSGDLRREPVVLGLLSRLHDANCLHPATHIGPLDIGDRRFQRRLADRAERRALESEPLLQQVTLAEHLSEERLELRLDGPARA